MVNGGTRGSFWLVPIVCNVKALWQIQVELECMSSALYEDLTFPESLHLTYCMTHRVSYLTTVFVPGGLFYLVHHQISSQIK